MSCVVINAYPPSTPGKPVLYVVQYDDGMMVEDRLYVPWDFVLPPPPQSVESGSSSELSGFNAIVEAAAAMNAETVVDEAELQLPSDDRNGSSSDAGTPSSLHSFNSGFSTATEILESSTLASAQSELDLLQEAPDAHRNFEAIDVHLASLMGFKDAVVYA